MEQLSVRLEPVLEKLRKRAIAGSLAYWVSRPVPRRPQSPRSRNQPDGFTASPSKPSLAQHRIRVSRAGHISKKRTMLYCRLWRGMQLSLRACRALGSIFNEHLPALLHARRHLVGLGTTQRTPQCNLSHDRSISRAASSRMCSTPTAREDTRYGAGSDAWRRDRGAWSVR